jgi:GxxExxY protein
MPTEIRVRNFPLSKETDTLIFYALEVHKNLGNGFLEIVYKDALELELYNNDIYFEREKEYSITYKNHLLKHKFYADFVVFDSVIVEIKAKEEIADKDFAQTINYLKCSGCKVGLILNFGKQKLDMKRVVF